MMEKSKQVEKLAKELSGSISIRTIFGLSNEGGVLVRHIKPSGATMQEKHRHIVEIHVSGKLVKSLPLPEYNRLMNSK